ncbi:MAG: hypothetical protein WCK09_19075 [Bacteroidota bacterium]
MNSSTDWGKLGNALSVAEGRGHSFNDATTKVHHRKNNDTMMHERCNSVA